MSHSHTRPPLSLTTHSYSDTDSDDSPLYTALDSSAALVLIHDDEDPEHDSDAERPLNLDFSTDDDDDPDDLDDSLSPLYQLNGRLTIPPLPPSTIFLYLISPYLKLGALLLPYYQLPLAYGLSGLLLSALLALITRHLLYLLARYLRKGDLEDVVTDSFVSSRKRGRGTERRRSFFRFIVRLGTASLRILLVVLYLRECVHYVLPLFTSDSTSEYPLHEVGLALVAVTLAMLLSYPKSLASRLVIYTTYFSVLAYISWFVIIIFLYTQGSFASNIVRETSSNVWAGLAMTAFIFTSSNTLPLYASTKGTIQPLLFNTNSALSGISPSSRRTGRNGHDKQPLYRSFKFLSLLSIIITIALMAPLVVFAAFPKGPGNSLVSDKPTTTLDPWNITTVYSTQAVSHGTILNLLPTYPARRDELTTPVTRIQNYLAPTLASLTLLFGTPQLLITIPPFPKNSFNFLRSNPHHHRRNIISSSSSSSPFRFLPNWIKRSSTTILITISLLTLILLSLFSHSDILTPTTVLLSILATYYVPSFLHILTHTFKSPLSIVLPTNSYFSSSSSSPNPQGASSAGILPTHVDGTSHIPDTHAGRETILEGGLSETLPTSTRESNQELPPPPPPPSTLNAEPNTTTSQRIRPSHSDSPSHLYSSVQDHDHAHDVLLQRKERALQRRQLRRRIIWDIWAWVIAIGGLIVLGVAAHAL